MAQVTKNIQNNFIAGLKTEYTALNFPENAATDCSNMTFSLIGDITRRGGIDFESGHVTNTSPTTSGRAFNTYKWNNVGGDGSTQIVVVQIGQFLFFYRSSSATTTSPLSTQVLSSSIALNSFTAAGGSFRWELECQFTDGNGYLFVFHPDCDPFYCTYNSANSTIVANIINIKIRDFTGIPDGLDTTLRPGTLSNEHNYNLINQGWSSTGKAWTATSTTTNTVNIPSTKTWNGVGATLGAVAGQVVSCFIVATDSQGHTVTTNVMGGTVAAYSPGSSGGSITINISSGNGAYIGQPFSNWILSCNATDYITDFRNAANAYPSNADVWWLYKNSSGVFQPSSTLGTVTIGGQAPRGSIVLNAFVQSRNGAYGSNIVSGITDISTTVRPRTGCWFQGRVFYAGVDGSQSATGDAPYTTWTENIYFSQIVESINNFGLCYQNNDPTSESFFDLLPTDGGVIVIQGSGPIYKLFPVQNGLLVFAANGIWFITGSQGIGFAANDYTVTKISGVHSISGTSFVNVLGWPYFWNSEGIYMVEPSQQGGGLEAPNVVVGNILSFYQEIPLSSKLYARGAYDPINYQLQWCYRSTAETGTTDRYKYDSILVHNTVEIRKDIGKAFYPYTVDTTLGPTISGIVFVENPSTGSTVPEPLFKYLTTSSAGTTFSEENNFSSYTDWLTFNGAGLDAEAFVITGYNLQPQHHPYYGYYAQALVKHSVSYVNVFIRNSSNNSYIFNSLWDWAISGSSGKFSSEQQVTNSLTYNNFQYITRRHRIRGRGYALQLRFQSVPNLPMDIVGWSIFEHIAEVP